MLACSCGARFELDDSLPGREILCPECQQPVKPLQDDRRPRVTSGWALSSVLLALIGAFTVVGTIVAVVLGIVALLSISRHRERVTGTGFAVVGICLGVVFTVLTVVAMHSDDLFYLESWLSGRDLAQKIDTSGPLEIVQEIDGFAITRPSEKWGQVPDQDSGDPAVGGFQEQLDLLLMQLTQHAFIDVRELAGNPLRSLDQCGKEILAEFESHHQQRDLFHNDGEEFRLPVSVHRLGERRLDARDGMDGREIEAEVRCAGKPWNFLIRLYRRGQGSVYVVRAYVQKRRFAAVRGELETALDSFRILRQ